MVKTRWLQYYEQGELPERFSQTIQSWDTANKATELSDYSVCTSWGVHDKRYYLLGVFRQRLNYPDLRRKVQELAKRDRPNKILIEDKASGTQLIQDLKADGIYAVTAYQPPSGTDKIMRLHAQTAAFENGRVLLPARAPWLSDYINELISFPGSRHDDQVDSTTQALDYLRTKSNNWFPNITPELLARARILRYRHNPVLLRALRLLRSWQPGYSSALLSVPPRCFWRQAWHTRARRHASPNAADFFGTLTAVG